MTAAVPNGSRARRWFALGGALLALLSFATVLAVASRALQGDLARVIEERGIEPDGLFYSETEEVSEAWHYWRNRRTGAREFAKLRDH